MNILYSVHFILYILCYLFLNIISVNHQILCSSSLGHHLGRSVSYFLCVLLKFNAILRNSLMKGNTLQKPYGIRILCIRNVTFIIKGNENDAIRLHYEMIMFCFQIH